MYNERNWKLSPSDFAFLWEDCKRCFYLKVAKEFHRPRSIMPNIFTIIDSEMKKFYSNKRIEEIAEGVPPGIVKYGEKWVGSEPIEIPGRSSRCFVSGKFDTVVKFDDGTYGVIDFKTSQRKSGHVSLYSRQLHAYAHALENPAPGKLGLGPVSRLGLLIFEPSRYVQGKVNVGLAGKLSWIEIPRNDALFLDFLSEVLGVLEMDSPPPANPDCDWCKYRGNSRSTGL